MKKILLILILTITMVLTGCIPNTTSNTGENTYTDEELRALIEELMPEPEENTDNTTVNTTYDLLSFQESIIGMLDSVKSGVLGIFASSEVSSGTGTGVIYKKEGNLYYIVTNAHVVVHSEETLVEQELVTTYYETIAQTIVFEKNSLLFEINETVELIGYDLTTDIAVLTFSSTEDFAVIPIADSYQLELGQFVFAIGNPLGFNYYGTVTMGVISGLARYVDDGAFSATLIQHDAALSPGNSGGALVNLNGELIGINNMKLVEESVSNIGFAIPSNTVKRITADLEDDGIVTRPYLGISTYAQVNTCGLDYGVCIQVQPGGAAEAAGLQNGDIIIGFKNTSMTEFKDVFNFNELKEAILNSSVGEIIVIKYIRDGEIYISDEATLGVHPED
ncbi:MAG: trypsin-like peptidase domain-containing protein [Firmicutes bacterium]|nr:trypsin-like peptidase domain-containing protein [Bacillota bacterium]